MTRASHACVKLWQGSKIQAEVRVGQASSYLLARTWRQQLQGVVWTTLHLSLDIVSYRY